MKFKVIGLYRSTNDKMRMAKSGIVSKDFKKQVEKLLELLHLNYFTNITINSFMNSLFKKLLNSF